MKVLSPGAGTLPLSIGGLDPPTQSYRIIHTLRRPGESRGPASLFVAMLQPLRGTKLKGNIPSSILWKHLEYW